MSAPEIDDDIVATLGPDVMSYSSVTRYLREARSPPLKPEPHPADVQRDLDYLDQAISAILEDSPFALVRQLSRLTHLPSTTLDRSLTQSLDLWRVTFDGCHMLCQMSKRVRESISPGDYCECSTSSMIEHGMTLSPSTSLGLTGVRIMNSSGYHEMKSSRKRTTHNSIEKLMLMIVCNPRGLYLIKILGKSRKFNAGYYITEMSEPLSQWRSIEAAGNKRKLLVHADNACPHIAKLSTQYFNEDRMNSAPHPPCSPDLAPSDFYLFGYVKKCFAGLSFEDAYQLIAAVEGVLEGIEKVTLQAVFLGWID
jgi:hypothetical protein